MTNEMLEYADADFEARERELTLTADENAKLLGILEHYRGAEYAGQLAERARQLAFDEGYTPDGWAERRAHAPVIVDLMFAADPARW